MNILIFNGSPKGKNSITIQTVLYLEKIFTNHNFTILNVGQKIKQYEKDMSEVKHLLAESNLIIFAYPVYTFIAPYQLHRFIELLKTINIDLSSKYATQISTSKHFYDVTAHKYIEENCYDLGFKYLEGLSADMDDLLKKQGQKDALEFFKYIEFCINNNLLETPKNAIHNSSYTTNSFQNDSVNLIEHNIKNESVKCTKEANQKYEIALITNCEKNDTHLKEMIDTFTLTFPYKVKIINIAEYPFDGGCLGCFNCASTGKCIYRDNFDNYLRTEIQSLDSMVYAFTIKDHSMGASFKMYDDRQFCNGHRTVSMGMPIGYIISGKYNSEHNLQTIIEGRAQVGHTYLTHVATDEIDYIQSIKILSEKLCYALEKHYTMPQNFYGVGGMKIFRDLIYLMRGLMKADHKFYKKKGIYDFPQKQKSLILKMQLIGILMRIPNVQKKMQGKMNDAIVGPYKKVINNINTKEI